MIPTLQLGQFGRRGVRASAPPPVFFMRGDSGLVDESNYARTVTSSGSYANVADWDPFGGSLKNNRTVATSGFPPTPGYIQAAYGSELDLGADDWTIEAYVYWGSGMPGATSLYFYNRSSANGGNDGGLQLSYESGQWIGGITSGSGSIFGAYVNLVWGTAPGLAYDTGTHVCFVRSGATLKLGIAGTLYSPTMAPSLSGLSIYASTGDLYINRRGGQNYSSDLRLMNYRITKYALYTGSTYTVPTS